MECHMHYRHLEIFMAEVKELENPEILWFGLRSEL